MDECIKELVYYFRDFLETDFKKGRLPKRRIEPTLSINCSNYQDLFNDVYKEILSLFSKNDDDDKSGHISVSPMFYNSIDTQLDVVKEKVRNYKITQQAENNFNDIVDKLYKIPNINSINALKMHVQCNNVLFTKEKNIHDNINEKIIKNFIGKQLFNNLFRELSTINFKYFNEIHNTIYSVVYNYIFESGYNNNKFDNSIFIDKIIKCLDEQHRTLFAKLTELKRTAEICSSKEEWQIYIYFYTITYNNATFPLFYIPVDIDVNTKNKLDIIIDNNIFINKKALTYILGGFDINCLFIKNRFFQFSESSKEEFNSIIFNVLKEFEQNKEYNNLILQNNNDNEESKGYKIDFVFKNKRIVLSNDIYFAAFAKTDELIINDYEEILNNTEITKEFSDIIDNYLSNKKNNNNIEDSIKDEYKNKNFGQKLFYNSPINLSPEQQKILMALNDENVKNIIVEGPPGTGKSHTIVSIIVNYILNNKSVLVLSDKQEAIEVVESKINDILNFVKQTSDIYNPILRLGTKNNFHNIIKKSNIELIKYEIEYNIDKYKLVQADELVQNNIEEYNSYQNNLNIFTKKQKVQIITILKILCNVLRRIHLNNNILLNRYKAFYDLKNIQIKLKDARKALFPVIQQKNTFAIKYFDAIKNINKNYSNKINDIKNDDKQYSTHIKQNIKLANMQYASELDKINNKINELDDKILKLQDDAKKQYLIKYNQAEEYLSKANIYLTNIVEYINNNYTPFANYYLKLKDINKLSLEKYNNFLEIIQHIHKNKSTINYVEYDNILLKISLDDYAQINNFINYYHNLSFFKKYIFKPNELKKYTIYFFEHFGIKQITKNIDKIIELKMFMDNIDNIKQYSNFSEETLFKIINLYFTYKLYNNDYKENNFTINLTDLKDIVKFLEQQNIAISDACANLGDILHDIQQNIENIINKYSNTVSITPELVNNVCYRAKLQTIDPNMYNLILQQDTITEQITKLKINGKYVITFNKRKVYYINMLNIGKKIVNNSQIKCKLTEINTVQIKYVNNIKLSKYVPIIYNLICLKAKEQKLTLRLINANNKYNCLDLLAQKQQVVNSIDILKNTVRNDTRFLKNFEYIDLYNYKNLLETVSKRNIYYKLLSNTSKLYKELRNSSNIRNVKALLKKKLPAETLSNILKYFPCVIASLRDYSSIIPLKKDIFDLIIIDEASQVNIAQAFPTLIRGKKVLILGDNKQFSNVKSTNAAKEANAMYLTKIAEVFKQYYKDKDANEKYKIFDIRNSVLDFINDSKPDFCIQLKTHFRGYPELISFSNKYFYNNTLQTLKIRKKELKEIIKFKILKNTETVSYETKNINRQESDFIINKLTEYLKKYQSSPKRPTIGIISPFTDQVTFITKEIANNIYCNEFYEYFKLKIMTFDSCQGEERDIIFYSMVATNEKDSLNYIFPINPSISVSYQDGSDEEANLKRQRLNVGFSRVKELAYFVLSKNIEDFHGSIKTALLHFYNESIKPDFLSLQTDKNSPMEEKIKQYIYQTAFFKEHNGKDLFFRTQFPIGDYLKQIDPKYTHPRYVVDFLLSVKSKNIIIEYDGAQYHFNGDVTRYNYCFMQNEEDYERQHILETYGYIFLRLNKFNLYRQDPVQYINDKLNSIVNN